jgi:hypothetical protein
MVGFVVSLNQLAGGIVVCGFFDCFDLGSLGCEEFPKGGF